MRIYCQYNRIMNQQKKGKMWNSKSPSIIPPTPMGIDFNKYDRPDISLLNKSRELQENLEYSKRPVSFISKKECIEKWLQTHPQSYSSSSSSSVITNSPPSKRPLRSPLKDCNQVKRLKTYGEMKKSISLIDVSHRKENVLQHEENNNAGNSEKTNVQHISDVSSNESITDRKLAACRAAIFGSTKRITRQCSPILETINKSSSWCTPAFIQPDHDLIQDVDSESSKEIDIESSPSLPPSRSIPSIDSESPPKSDRSIPSPIVQIDTESSDDDHDITISEVIEDPETCLPPVNVVYQNSPSPSVLISVVSSESSDVSGGTFFEAEDPLDKTLIPAESSQKISQDSRQSTRDFVVSDVSDHRSLIISSGNSPPVEEVEHESYRTVNVSTFKKKKKPKKGSLMERLQTLITGQISFLRIWRHQQAQSHLKGSSQYVEIKVNQWSWQYGRQFFVGSVVDDANNLLEKSKSLDNSHNDTSDDCIKKKLKKIVKIITVPEIVGEINLNKNNGLRIYPPWEVISDNELVLSVLYFSIINDSSCDNDNSTKVKSQTVEQFDCPCLKEKRIVHSCDVKFTDVKPNAMQYLFDIQKS